MKKKLIGLLLTVTMTASMLAACGNDAAPADAETGDTTPTTEESTEPAPSSDVELTMWSMFGSTEPQGVILQEAADAYKQQTGVTVNIEWKGRDVKTLIASALEAEDDVDIFQEDYARINQTYAPYCLDLGAMAEAAGYADQSYACFVDVSKDLAGFMTSVAEQPNIGGIFYNKDIFAECGIEVPATWTEFLAACQTMVDNGYEPMALDSAYADFWFGYHLDRVIGEAKTTELAINGGWDAEPGVAVAAQQIIDFVNAGYLESNAPDEYPNSQNKMGLADVPMIVCADYVCAEVDNATESSINWGVFNYPEVEDGSGSVNAYAGANSLAIAKHCEHPQEAFDFIMFLTSGEYDAKKATDANQIPADPSNADVANMDGSVDTLLATKAPLSWSMGLNQNSDLTASIKDIVIRLFAGEYATGEDFAAAMQALY